MCGDFPAVKERFESGDDNLEGYIYGIVKRLYYRIKNPSRKREQGSASIEMREIAGEDDYDKATDEAFYKLIAMAAAEKVLTPKQWVAFTLRFIYNHSMKEISLFLGTERTSVQDLIYTARDKIKIWLNDRGLDDMDAFLA